MGFATGGSFDNGEDEPMLSEINMIPLIDVMLVLLVIFLVTAPMLTHSVRIDLPRASGAPTVQDRAHVQLAIDAAGALHWNGERVDHATLLDRLRVEGARGESQPELHLRADRRTEYQVLADVMAEAARAGLTRIGFVSEPMEPR